MTEKDYLANRDAVFHPYVPDGQNNGAEALPCIEIGGVQVYAYVRDGTLIISAHLEEADEQVFDLYADEGAADNVPVIVHVGAWDEPVFRAVPEGKEWTEI